MINNKLFVFIVIVAILAAVYPYWLPQVGLFLTVKSNVDKADCILILNGGEGYGRESRAAGLYKKGFARKIIKMFDSANIARNSLRDITDPDEFPKAACLRYFQSNGIGQEAVIAGETTEMHTFGELTAAREVIKQNKFNSLILVSGDYQMRRSLMTARWLFKSLGVKVYNASSYPAAFNPYIWWTSGDDRKAVAKEYGMIALYLFYHFMLGE